MAVAKKTVIKKMQPRTSHPKAVKLRPETKARTGRTNLAATAVIRGKSAATQAPEKPGAAGGDSLSLKVLDTAGKSAGTVSVPKSLFDASVNSQLIAQAVRVYRMNQRSGQAATKTRGEVEGSTRKIFRQKGTGRARHGSIRSPIFVGGGIVFGPRPRTYAVSMPKTMRRQAVAGALTSRLREGRLVVVAGIESIQPKTKLMARTLGLVAPDMSVLLLTKSGADGVVRASRNIPDCLTLPARSLNTYAVMSQQMVVITREAIGELKETLLK